VAVRQGCLRCHNVDTKEPATGPSWVDLYQQQIKLTDGREIVADEAYLTESMMEPTVKVVAGYQELMPNYQGKLSGAEAAAIVEFIKSLRSDRTVQAVGGEEQ
jgi:cytochrome c oxidase subunit 2